MSINQVAISGNLGRDAELKTTRSGQSVVTFSVAVNSRKKGDNGEFTDYPNWVDCVFYGKLAEVLAPRLVKGVTVSVGGQLSYSTWEGKDGKRSKLEVVVKDMEVLRSDATVSGGSALLYDEDIPF